MAEKSTKLNLGIAPGHCNGTCFTIAASRRPDLVEAEPPWPAPNRLPPLRYATAAAAGSLPQTNSVPYIQIRCGTVASLRANATFALRMPRRLAMSIAQRFSVLNLVARVSRAFGASCKAVRTPASPNFAIAPTTSDSPDWYRLGVKPKKAPTDRTEHAYFNQPPLAVAA